MNSSIDQGFKALTNSHVQIGRKIFKVHQHDFRNGVTSNLEVAGASGAGFMEVLPLDELRAVRIMDFPDGFMIDIYMPTLPHSTEVEGLSLKHVFQKGRVSFRVGYVYGKFEIEKNLLIYAKELSAKFLMNIKECRAVEFFDEEVGVGIRCDLDVPIDIDLYQYLHALDKRINKILRDDPSDSSKDAVVPDNQLKPDEQGVKWWIRYACVLFEGDN